MEETMRRLTRVVTVVPLALVAGLLTAPGSSAETTTLPPPQVAWVGNIVVSHGGDAYILAKFRCYGGETATHLWASVKQGGPDPTAEGSGVLSDAWYDTNYQYANDPAGQTIQCDGKWHVQHFLLKRVDHPFGTDYVSGMLKSGTAWVQFCVFDSSATDDNFPTGFAYDYGWKRIVAAN